MSEMKMLKNERRNRRKAMMITALFYMGTIGGILFYTNSSVDFSSHLPDQVKEWLDIEEAKEETKTNKPRA